MFKRWLLIHPRTPVRTRFAPSPTGLLHLGSIRTALYNFLLAKSTGGKFILRLEDTDQSRLVKGAEQNIYDTLQWCGIISDEGPVESGPVGPYRQSERKDIYKKYAEQLVRSGHAYYCYCSKQRLNDLRQSAMKLKPPTTVTYDRKCLYSPESIDSSSESVPVIRFKSPKQYRPITDLIHGQLNLQPQINPQDRRYDDIVILKSDGLPTYHFANVVDDHLMGITHVIRGEEWLYSTPKHIAMYDAFGWQAPQFVHLPLLTSLNDKKLLKRDASLDVLSLKNKILPQALVNFVALFGWSPRRTPGVPVSEVMTMQQLISSFSLDHLTNGNAKVSTNKLNFFNKHHLIQLVQQEPELTQLALFFQRHYVGDVDLDYLKLVLRILAPNLDTLDDINNHKYLFGPVEYISKSPKNLQDILQAVIKTDYDLDKINQLDFNKKNIFQVLRFALTGGVSGLSIVDIVTLIGPDEFKRRINSCL